MTQLLDKFDLTAIFLRDHYRRFANCQANVQMIANEIPVADDRFFEPEDFPAVAEAVLEALQRCQHRLADNYTNAIREFFSRHSEFADHEANRRVVADALEKSSVAVPDENDLEDLLDPGNHNGVFGSLLKSAEAVEAEGREERRASLVDKVLANAPVLVTGTSDKEGERAKRKAREEWEKRIRAMSLPDLIRVRQKQELRSGSTDAAREIVLEADKQKADEFHDKRFTHWPGVYVPPGKDASVGVPLTVQLFRRLPAHEISRLFRIFGESQINAALAASQQKS